MQLVHRLTKNAAILPTNRLLMLLLNHIVAKWTKQSVSYKFTLLCIKRRRGIKPIKILVFTKPDGCKNDPKIFLPLLKSQDNPQKI